MSQSVSHAVDIHFRKPIHIIDTCNVQTNQWQKVQLYILPHLVIDHWFPGERHSVAGETDQQASNWFVISQTCSRDRDCFTMILNQNIEVILSLSCIFYCI